MDAGHSQALATPEEDSGADSGTTDAARKPRVRAQTISVKRLSKRTLAIGAMRYDASINAEFPRPRTYGECDTYDLGDGPVALGIAVPCPFASCWYNTKHEVSERTGSIKDTRPDVALEDMPPDLTCTLRLADLGGLTLEDLGARTGRTRERIRQIETKAMAKLKTLSVLVEGNE